MKSIEKLREKSQEALHALWAAEAIERDKSNAALIGKCFKYRNSGGGCGDEKWWLYVKITGVDEGNLRAFKFQQYPNEHIEIDPNEWIYHARSFDQDGGYIEILASEFDHAWSSLAAKVARYQP